MDLGESSKRKPRFLQRTWKWLANERGNIGPLLALMVVPLVGAFALAGEGSSWYVYERSQQNAADSAVMAAAMKEDTAEAGKVTAKYGYVDGQNSVTVASTSGSTICPAGVSNLQSNTCYKVAITRTVPLYLTRIVGYRDAITGTKTSKSISASAIAGLVTGTTYYCLVSQQDITFNGGGSKPNLGGCSMLAGGNLKCDSSNTDIGVPVGSAGGTNGTNGGTNTCGSDPRSGQTFTNPLTAQVTTAMSDFNSAHPSNSCTTPLNGQISQSDITQGGVNYFCGNGAAVTLAGNITVSGDNTVIAFQNGGLNLNNFTISTTSGGLTILFTGTQLTTTLVNWGNSGGFDFAAPTSGDWSGLAIVVDPSLQGGTIKNGKFTACTSSANGNGCPQDLTTSGGQSSPPLHLTGLIYDANGAVTISGTIDKASSSPNKCIGIDADFIISNGGENFLETTAGCLTAGANLPTIPVIALLK